jgi:F-type H+-transporting ATPase subunit b
MLNLDSTLLFQIINFLIIVIVSKTYILKPILNNIQRRNEKLEYLQKEFKTKEEKINELRKIYDLKLLEARNKLNEERKVILDSLKKSLDDNKNKEKKVLDNYYRDKIITLQNEASNVMKELSKEVPEFSKLIIEKVL